MKLFENPRQAFLLLGFLVLSVAFYVATYSNNAEFQAKNDFIQYQPKTAQSFVESIGVTTHLTYTDYKSNAYFPDVFNSLVKPKIRELGIHHIRQYPGEVDSNFPTYVSNYNELSNPSADYPRIKFNFETYVDPSVSSNPQNNCYMPKMKYIIFGIVGNCGGLQNHTAPSNVLTGSIENPNEPDHCASFICNYSPSPSNWYTYSLQQNPNWPDDVLQTAQAAHTKLSNDSQTSSFERLAPAFVWLPYHQNETYNGTNLKTYLEPLKNYITHGNAHPYCHLLSVATCFTQQVQPIVDHYAPKPTIVTETGHSTGNYSETQHAKYLLRILFDFFERGIPRTYIYEFLDEPSAANQEQRNYGLINEDGREKPAFTWLKNTITLLKDNGNVGLKALSMQISGNGLRHSLLQKSDGSHWLALQYDKSNTADTDATTAATVTFASAKNVEYYSPSNTVAYKTDTGVTTLSISVPDKITLLRISDPAAPASSSGSNTTSSSGSSSTTKKSNGKSSGGTSSQSGQSGQSETATTNTGFELKENQLQLTKDIAVSKNILAAILVVSILAVTAIISWLRLRRELHQKKP